MKSLIAYNCLSDGIERFREVQAIQQKLNPQIARADRLLVSEKPIVLDGFLNEVKPIDAKDKCAIAQTGNTSISYAQEHGYDYVLLCDIDSVVLDPIPFIGDKFSCCWLYLQTEEEYKAGDFFGLYNPKWPGWKPGANFLLPRAAMHLRFDESFLGHYWQDYDFFWNVLVANGFDGAPYCPRMIHVWHPVRVDDDAMLKNRNRQKFIKRFVEIRKHFSATDFEMLTERFGQPLAGMIQAFYWERVLWGES